MRPSAIVLAAMSAATLFAPFSATGQSNPYNGSWHATFKGFSGANRDGTVIIADEGGSWDMNITNSSNPCIGRKFPIAVQKATAEELEFTVNGSKTLVGCPDTQLTFGLSTPQRSKEW
ncbi:hypothetical protein [Variovorax sp. J31P207]|uniref:hypothetical protein n=1 Tax=Variovorax sp. J31P207 TaxID=3053510 RepID=UPI0025790B98|nr:hypothetical protein [Variovorax sp. J31P207]MDM0066563.1 hypothetical protein [Variovorax sp. J31P207]